MRQAFLVEQPRHHALRALNYEPAIEQLRRPRRSQAHVRLREIVADLGSGYATVFARVDCDRAFGVELLSQSDMFAAEPSGRVIRRDSMLHPHRHEVRRWQVLIAGAGTLAPTELYGRAIIADARLAGKYVGQDSLVLEFQRPEDDFTLFAYAFMASPTGLRALRSTSYGTKILRIRRDVLADLPIPRPAEATIRAVATLIRDSVAKRELSAALLAEATQTLCTFESMLGNEDGLYGRGAAHVRLTTTGSLAARNHRLAARLFSDSGVTIGSLLQGGWPRKAQRFTRTPCDKDFGVPFFGQRDLFLIRPSPQSVRNPELQGLQARRASIIVAAAGQSGEGTLFGRTALGDFFEGHLVSEHTLHLDIDTSQVDHQFLFAVLRTPWGIGALKSCGTGTSVPSLDPRLLIGLSVPRLPTEAEARVVNLVGRAFAARRVASDAEAKALQIIEEEVLPEWLA